MKIIKNFLLFQKTYGILPTVNYYTAYFDGSCNPNPGGVAGYGFTLYKSGILIDSGHGVIGSGPGMTNNYAEHHAIGQAFAAFLKHYDGAPNTLLTVRGDSQLVVNQMSDRWAVSPNKAYYSEAAKALNLLKEIRRKRVQVDIDWIPREQNKVCDELSKK